MTLHSQKYLIFFDYTQNWKYIMDMEFRGGINKIHVRYNSFIITDYFLCKKVLHNSLLFQAILFLLKAERKIRCLCSFLHVGGTWFSSFCFLCLVYHICILYVWLVFTCIDQTIDVEIKIVRNDVLKRIKNSTRIIRKHNICDIYNLWYITEFLMSI